MSRQEHNEDFTAGHFDDDSQWRNNNLFNQSYCSYCYEPHCPNDVGIISPKHKVWFCGGACQAMYFHDNKLTSFSPETVAVIQEMRKKFYSEEKLTQRRKKVQHH